MAVAEEEVASVVSEGVHPAAAGLVDGLVLVLLHHLPDHHLHQAERGDLELRVVIPSNNGQMEDENHPLLELQLEAEVLLIQKLLVMEVHSVLRIPTATNHQVMEQNSERVSLKELESMVVRDLARRP